MACFRSALAPAPSLNFITPRRIVIICRRYDDLANVPAIPDSSHRARAHSAIPRQRNAKRNNTKSDIIFENNAEKTRKTEEYCENARKYGNLRGEYMPPEKFENHKSMFSRVYLRENHQGSISIGPGKFARGVKCRAAPPHPWPPAKPAETTPGRPRTPQDSPGAAPAAGPARTSQPAHQPGPAPGPGDQPRTPGRTPSGPPSPRTGSAQLCRAGQEETRQPRRRGDQPRLRGDQPHQPHQRPQEAQHATQAPPGQTTTTSGPHSAQASRAAQDAENDIPIIYRDQSGPRTLPSLPKAARTGSGAAHRRRVAPSPTIRPGSAMPEIGTRDSTSPGPEDRRTAPAAHAGQIHRDRPTVAPSPCGPSPCRDRPRTGPDDKTHKNHALKLCNTAICP